MNKTDNAASIEQSSSVNNKQTAAKQVTASQNEQNQANKQDDANTGNTVTNSSTQNNKETNAVENNKQANTTSEKQPTKPDLSTFPGLSLFFTDVKNADAKDNAAKIPAQGTNAGKNDQDQTDAKGDKTPVAPKKDDALIAAASDLQNAITKGNAYVNSDEFTQMTAEKQKQLRAAIQAGKELMVKYNTMQAAMNSATLEVDQNNKNKAETKTNANVAALTTLNVNNNTSADTNANLNTDNTTTIANTTVTTSELKQAAQSIMTLIADPASTKIIDSGDPEQAWTDFKNALESPDITTIDLETNIVASDNASTQLKITTVFDPEATVQDSNHKKIINGNNHTINLKNYTFIIQFDSHTDGNDTVSINDATIDGTNIANPTFKAVVSSRCILNNVTTKDAVNFNNVINGLYLTGKTTINFTMSHTDGSIAENSLFYNTHISCGSHSDDESAITINCKPDQQANSFYSFSQNLPGFSDFQLNRSHNITININNVKNVFDGTNLNIGVNGGNNNNIIVNGDNDNLFSTTITNPEIDATGGSLTLLDNAKDPDISALKITSGKTYDPNPPHAPMTALGMPKILTIKTDNPAGFTWNGLTDISTKNIGLLYQKPNQGEIKHWVIANATDTNFQNDTSIAAATFLPPVTSQATPTNEISTKGYTAKTYAFDIAPWQDKSTLEGYPYADKFSEVSWGTDLAAKTDSGRYDTTAADQTLAAFNDGKAAPDASSILTFEDENDNNSKKDIATLKTTVDYFGNTKTITDVAWENNTYLDSEGHPQTGGIIDANGKFNIANAKTAHPDTDLGNALIKVTYGDGTTDEVPVKFTVQYNADLYKNAKPTITTHKVDGSAVSSDTEAINKDDLTSLIDTDDTDVKDKVDSVKWDASNLPTLSDTPDSTKLIVHFTGDPADKVCIYPASQVTIKTQPVVTGPTKMHTVIKTMPSQDDGIVTDKDNSPVKALNSTDVTDIVKWNPKFSWVKKDGTALTTDDLQDPTTADGMKVGIKIEYFTNSDRDAASADGYQIVPVYLVVDSEADAYKNAQATIITHKVIGDLTSATEAIDKSDLKLVNGTDKNAPDISNLVDSVKWDSSYPTLSDDPTSAKIIVHFKDDPATTFCTYPASQVTIKTQKVEADDSNIQKTDPSKLPDATRAEAALKSTDTGVLGKWNPVYSWAKDAAGTALTTDDINKPTGPDGKKEYVLIKYYTDQSHSESSFDGQQTVKVNLIVNNFADAYKNATATITTHQVAGTVSANEAINLKDLKLTNGTGPDSDITNDVDSVEWADTPDLSGKNGLTVHAEIKVHFKNDPADTYATYDTDHVTVNLADVKAGAKVHTALKTLPNNDSSVKALNSTDVGNLKDWHPQFSWVKTNGDPLAPDDLSTVTPSGSDGTAVGIKINYYTDSDKPDGYEIVPVKLIVDSDAVTYKDATAVVTTHKVDGNLSNANQAISIGDLSLTSAAGDDISGKVDSVKWVGTLPDLSGTNTASAEIEVHFKDDPSSTTQTYATDHVTVKLVDVAADDNNKQNVDVKSLPTADQAQAALLKDDMANISKWNPVFSWTKDKQGTALTADDVKTATGASGQPEYVLIKYYTDSSHSEASFDGEEYVPVMLRVGYKAPKPNNGNHIPEPDRTPKLPIPGEVDIPQGTDLSGDTTYAGDAITNKDQMPDGTKYSWQPAPDTSKKGKQEGTVVVTYPDGTKVSFKVTVNIVDKNANTNGSGNNGNNNHGEAKEEVLKHNAYLYGQDGKRANKAVLKAGSTVTTYGMVVINGRKFFTLDNDYYLATGNAVAQTRKLKHNAYIYNKYGKRVGKKVVKTGQSMATYGTVVTIRGKKYYTIDHNHFMKANNFTKIANPDLANSELSPNAKQDSNKAFTIKALKHNAYLYNKEGKRANKVILNLNSKVKTYGTKTINGRKFYVAANNYYIAAGNIDAMKRKLTHNAYIYSQYGNRIGRKVVKQHQVVGTYGDPVGIRGKSYYIIGSGRYLKRANFETR